MTGRKVRTTATRVLAAVAASLLATGCAMDNADSGAPGSPDEVAQQTTDSRVSTTAPTAAEKALVQVDPESLASAKYDDRYMWNYSTGGRGTGLCVASNESVTCTGTPHAAVPDLAEHFPGRPGAIEVGPAGLRYTFIEGIPPAPGRLEAGQEVKIGAARCAMPDDASLECHADGGSFTIGGSDHAIATQGTVLDEQDYSNFPDAQSITPSSSSQRTPTQSEQPLDFMGATGLVSGVRTSAGRLVTASTPPCDGRGILILDSYVETLAPQQGIANLIDRYPGAEFATPGQCPSLRASLDSARVYPIYVDHGFDTAGLCRDKAARGGNARLLANAPEFVDPC